MNNKSEIFTQNLLTVDLPAIAAETTRNGKLEAFEHVYEHVRFAEQYGFVLDLPVAEEIAGKSSWDRWNRAAGAVLGAGMHVPTMDGGERPRPVLMPFFMNGSGYAMAVDRTGQLKGIWSAGSTRSGRAKTGLKMSQCREMVEMTAQGLLTGTEDHHWAAELPGGYHYVEGALRAAGILETEIPHRIGMASRFGNHGLQLTGATTELTISKPFNNWLKALTNRSFSFIYDDVKHWPTDANRLKGYASTLFTRMALGSFVLSDFTSPTASEGQVAKEIKKLRDAGLNLH